MAQSKPTPVFTGNHLELRGICSTGGRVAMTEVRLYPWTGDPFA